MSNIGELRCEMHCGLSNSGMMIWMVMKFSDHSLKHIFVSSSWGFESFLLWINAELSRFSSKFCYITEGLDR